MSSNDATASAPCGNRLDHTVTATTDVTLPEKAALSKATTVVTLTMDGKGDSRPSKDSWSKDSFTKSDRSVNAFDTDLEACPSNLELDNTHTTNRTLAAHRKSDCPVWPGQKQMKLKAKLAKRKRGCGCMAGMSRRNRIIMKIAIVLLIIGIGIGVGFGVSKPLKAPIWGDHD
jgi:hypothetical protein